MFENENNSENYPLFEINKKDFHKSHFFKKLLEIPQVPEKIYFKGEVPKKETKVVAVVGSRNISDYGKNAVKKILKEISGFDITILSGLALGTDTEAHRNAISNNLKTIAVPGSGINEKVIYPRTNKKLSGEILSNNGLILSEFEPDFKATLWSFPARNRIMVGLADLVVIVEASEKSGTLITARLATDYNKDLMALPGSIFSQNSVGTNKLLNQGAAPITSGVDILKYFNFEIENKMKDFKVDNLNEVEKEIINILKEPLYKEEIFAKLKIETSEILINLTTLELKDLIKDDAGKIYLQK